MILTVQLFAPDHGVIATARGDLDVVDGLVARTQADPGLTAWLDLQAVPFRVEQMLLNQQLGLPAVAVRGFQCLAGPSLEERGGHVLVRLDELDFDAATFAMTLSPIGFFFTRQLLITRHVERSPCIELYRQEQRLPQTAAEAAPVTPSGIAVRLAGLLAGRYVTLLSSIETRLEQLGMSTLDDVKFTSLKEQRGKLNRLHRVLDQHGALFASLDALSLPFSDDVRQRLKHLQGHLRQALSVADRYRIVYGSVVG